MPREPECDPGPVWLWAEIARPEATASDINTVYKIAVRDWLTWGAEHAVTATSEQRQKVLDAVVLLDTFGSYFGTEAVVRSPGDERDLRMAQARRAQLAKLSDTELAEQCRIVLEEALNRDQSFAASLAQYRIDRSQVARDRVSIRWWYGSALEEFARHYRSKGKGWSAQRAIQALESKSKPYHCTDGTILSVQDKRIKMEHPDHGSADIAAEQFRKTYWPRAK
jgi:hypothetical protein